VISADLSAATPSIFLHKNRKHKKVGVQDGPVAVTQGQHDLAHGSTISLPKYAKVNLDKNPKSSRP
jgi:hypothetical protein